MPFPVP
jgi:hypothetical protein